MSKLFFDQLVLLTEVENHIKKFSNSEEEKHELWQIVDETIHHKVFDIILSNLHQKHHLEFLRKFHVSPHDERLLDFISKKSKIDISKIIKLELKKLEKEILTEIKIQSKIKK